MRIAKTVGLIFLMCSPAWSQDWQGAFEELERECEDRINSLQATTDSLAGAVKAQQITIQKANTLIADLTKYQEVSEGLVVKYAEMVVLSDSTRTLLKNNVELAKANAEEWEDLATYLKEEYKELIEKYSRSLWQRWELYAGLVAGLLVGIAL